MPDAESCCALMVVTADPVMTPKVTIIRTDSKPCISRVTPLMSEVAATPFAEVIAIVTALFLPSSICYSLAHRPTHFQSFDFSVDLRERDPGERLLKYRHPVRLQPPNKANLVSRCV